MAKKPKRKPCNLPWFNPEPWIIGRNKGRAIRTPEYDVDAVSQRARELKREDIKRSAPDIAKIIRKEFPSLHGKERLVRLIQKAVK